MSGALDMSLEDLIGKNKRSEGGRSGFRGRGRDSGAGPFRRFSDRGINRGTPYTKANPVQASNLFNDRAFSLETGTKLYISNLDYGVSNDDIKELFLEFGDLKRYSIHYDRSGRSKGTAEVVFSRQADALSAVKRYNNVQLDGRPLKIEIVGANVATPAAVPPIAIGGMIGSFDGVSRSGLGRGGTMRQSRGDGGSRGRGFGRGRGQERGRVEHLSAKDLDAELEKYHAEAMQIN